MQTLRCADFYAGCGGLSFVDKQTDKVHITTKWAVDFCDSMTLSFKANYPEAEVVHLIAWIVTGFPTATEAFAMVASNKCTPAEALLLLLHMVQLSLQAVHNMIKQFGVDFVHHLWPELAGSPLILCSDADLHVKYMTINAQSCLGSIRNI